MASNLDQDPDTQSDIHVRMLAGVPTTIWASRRALGALGASVMPSISGDGTRVSFESDAVLRTAGANKDTNGQRDIFGDSDHAGARDEVIEQVEEIGCDLEWYSENLLAVDAADDGLAQRVADFLQERERLGHLVFETGRTA